MFGIGKSKSIKAAEKVPLNYLGEQNADMQDIIEEGKKFVAKCFGLSETSSSRTEKPFGLAKQVEQKLQNHQP